MEEGHGASPEVFQKIRTEHIVTQSVRVDLARMEVSPVSASAGTGCDLEWLRHKISSGTLQVGAFRLAVVPSWGYGCQSKRSVAEVLPKVGSAQYVAEFWNVGVAGIIALGMSAMGDGLRYFQLNERG
ncbi:MAG: hypothetical protein ACE361_22665 [Aureliella sp.]